MTWIVRKLISPPFQCTSITNRVLSLIDRFTAYYNCMTWNVRKLISSRSQFTSITNPFSYLIWPFHGLLQLYDLKCQKTHIFAISVHKYHKSLFLPYLTVLRFITTVWPQMSENSYLRDFSAQVSQIVFLAYLTVLRLITTVWPEMSENSYLHNFSAQVSQTVFLAYLTVLQLITTVWPDMSENSYLRDFSAQVSPIVFTAYLTVLRLITAVWPEVSQNRYLHDFNKYHKSFSLLIWPFYGLLQLYELKCQKTHIFAISEHKYHKTFS